MSVEQIEEYPEGLTPPRRMYRAAMLDDVHVREDGSGRIVEAYATVWNQRAEVFDEDGHYHEVMAPTSYAKTVRERGLSFGVLFNHGRTIEGTPSELDAIPIGVPLEVRPDDHGLFTVTRFLDNPRADHVLSAIKARAITSYSVGGEFIKSSRAWPDGRMRPALPVITRHEVKMRDYGPVTFPSYEGARILGTRAATLFAEAVLALPEDKRASFLQSFEVTLPVEDEPTEDIGTPAGAAEQTDEPADGHSALSLRSRIRAARIVRGME